jgi:hypothetical protein
MDGKMVPVFTPEAEATYDSLIEPVALASRKNLQHVLLRVYSVSDVAMAIATEMLSPISATSATSTVASGSKRKASDAETIYRCNRCHLRVETDNNLPKDCIYHPGKRLAISILVPAKTQHNNASSSPADLPPPQVARRSTRTPNAPTTIWSFGPTTTTPVTDPRKILSMSRIMREVSNGHAAIGEAMQMDVKLASMMSGSSGQMLEGRKSPIYGVALVAVHQAIE